MLLVRVSLRASSVHQLRTSQKKFSTRNYCVYMSERGEQNNKRQNKKLFVAALDQGTSSTRVVLYDHSGRAVLHHQIPLPLITPKPGWVEQDPEYIMKTCYECLEQVSHKAHETGVAPGGLSSQNVAALGITNQRETTIAWDRITGKPLHNSLVWLDTRTRVVVSNLIDRFGSAEKFKASTGLPISTYFSATKIKWLMDNVPAVRTALDQQRAVFGTVDAWITWNLTGGANFVTDVTNASRTMLMDLESLTWNREICSELGIAPELLPEIKSSSEVYGTIKNGPLEGVPIAGCLGDQQAALVGQRCFSAGSAKNTYGTGCFMLYNTGAKPVLSKHGLLTTMGYKLGPNAAPAYALEGSVAIAGAGIEWLKTNLGIISDPKEIDGLAGSVPSTGGLFFVPAFSGLFAPYWRPDARGVAIGMTAFTTKAHFARAMLESVAFQTTEILAAMEADSSVKIQQLKVDGGLSKSNLLMQIQADLLGLPVKRPGDIETTARGAAYAAALAVGFWDSDDGKSPIDEANSALKRTFTCGITEHNREKRLALWKKAVERTLDWAIDDDHDDHDQDDKEFSN